MPQTTQNARPHRPELKVRYSAQRTPGIIERATVPRKTRVNGRWVPDASKPTKDIVLAYNYVDVILTSTDCYKRKDSNGQWTMPLGWGGKQQPQWFLRVYPSGEEVVFFDGSMIYDGEKVPHLYSKMIEAIKVALTGPDGRVDWTLKDTIRSHIFRLGIVPTVQGRTTYTFQYVGRVPPERAAVFAESSDRPVEPSQIAQERAGATNAGGSLPPQGSVFRAPMPVLRETVPNLSQDQLALIAAFNKAIEARLAAGETKEALFGGDVPGVIVASLTAGLDINGAHVSIDEAAAKVIAANPSQYGISL